mmetsp:Transcript_61481/g.109580  ORF Transcript_61481/g.109580 Transcript_61481/m.109580 type:complete len:578 (-) Transcript_61481:876-2609(-)
MREVSSPKDLPEGMSLQDYVACLSPSSMDAGSINNRPLNRARSFRGGSSADGPPPSSLSVTMDNRPVTRQKLPTESLDLFLPNPPGTKHDDSDSESNDELANKMRAASGPNFNCLFMASDEEFGDEPVFPPKSASAAFRVSQVDWDEAFVRGGGVGGEKEKEKERRRKEEKRRGGKDKTREKPRPPMGSISGEDEEDLYLSKPHDSTDQIPTEMHDWINSSFEALDNEVIESIDQGQEHEGDASLYDLLMLQKPNGPNYGPRPPVPEGPSPSAASASAASFRPLTANSSMSLCSKSETGSVSSGTSPISPNPSPVSPSVGAPSNLESLVGVKPSRRTKKKDAAGELSRPVWSRQELGADEELRPIGSGRRSKEPSKQDDVLPSARSVLLTPDAKSPTLLQDEHHPPHASARGLDSARGDSTGPRTPAPLEAAEPRKVPLDLVPLGEGRRSWDFSMGRPTSSMGSRRGKEGTIKSGRESHRGLQKGAFSLVEPEVGFQRDPESAESSPEPPASGGRWKDVPPLSKEYILGTKDGFQANSPSPHPHPPSTQSPVTGKFKGRRSGVDEKDKSPRTSPLDE